MHKSGVPHPAVTKKQLSDNWHAINKM